MSTGALFLLVVLISSLASVLLLFYCVRGIALYFLRYSTKHPGQAILYCIGALVLPASVGLLGLVVTLVVYLVVRKRANKRAGDPVALGRPRVQFKFSDLFVALAALVLWGLAGTLVFEYLLAKEDIPETVEFLVHGYLSLAVLFGFWVFCEFQGWNRDLIGVSRHLVNFAFAALSPLLFPSYVIGWVCWRLALKKAAKLGVVLRPAGISEAAPPLAQDRAALAPSEPSVSRSLSD